MSDNEVKKLDNFPVMKRLNTLILNNNNISKLASNLGDNLKGITTLILTNNKITQVSEIDYLSTLKKLEHLSLMENPVIQSLGSTYRLYVIYKIPSLKSLDYMKIEKKERDPVELFFKSTHGTTFLNSIGTSSGSSLSSSGLGSGSGGLGQDVAVQGGGGGGTVLSEAQKLHVRRSIEAATTREEVDAIERQLRVGMSIFDFISS